MVCLKTARLLVRDPKPIDLAAWHRLMSDPMTMYYLPDLMTHSLEESAANLEAAIAEAQSPDRRCYFFAIENGESGAFIGSIGYTVMQNTPVGKFVGVGYFILPEHHGKGYTTEALMTVLRYAFEENDVFRVSTGCNAENQASECVMQKCGLVKEASFQSAVWHDGRLCDRVEYRMLRDEWFQMQGPDA